MYETYRQRRFRCYKLGERCLFIFHCLHCFPLMALVQLSSYKYIEYLVDFHGELGFFSKEKFFLHCFRGNSISLFGDLSEIFVV